MLTQFWQLTSPAHQTLKLSRRFLSLHVRQAGASGITSRQEGDEVVFLK